MINRASWEHLAPKPMHRRFREVETLLRQWCRSEYGAHWLRIARQKHGVIRVKPGQFIPVVHFIALGDSPVFIAPQLKVRLGHRMVGSDQFRSGDVAPSFYPALSSPFRLVTACWPLGETGSGAEPFAGRSGRSRLGWKVAAKADGVCHPSPECGREPL